MKLLKILTFLSLIVAGSLSILLPFRAPLPWWVWVLLGAFIVLLVGWGKELTQWSTTWMIDEPPAMERPVRFECMFKGFLIRVSPFLDGTWMWNVFRYDNGLIEIDAGWPCSSKSAAMDEAVKAINDHLKQFPRAENP